MRDRTDSELPFEGESEPTDDEPRRLHPAWMVLLWVMAIVLALLPIPWW